MTDRIDKRIRHRIMAANRSLNTSPEKEVRQALFRHGLRFRLHAAELPGRPDIVLPKYRAVVFMHGCYWHGHDCSRRPQSKSNTAFWAAKIRRNQARDMKIFEALAAAGWRIMVVWECSVRRQNPPFFAGRKAEVLSRWVRGSRRFGVISESGITCRSLI